MTDPSYSEVNTGWGFGCYNFSHGATLSMTDLADKELECPVMSGAKCLAKVAGDGGEHD